NGRPVQGIAGASGQAPLTAEDPVPEPDVLPDYHHMEAFFARQSALAAILSDSPRLVIAGTGDMIPLKSGAPLPLAFWQQLLTGLIGFAISAWIWSVGPKRLPNILFALS